MKRRILAGIAALAMAGSSIPAALPEAVSIVVHADETAADSGTCGSSLTWTLDAEGTLTISGDGYMDYWWEENPAPWYDQREAIRAVVIGDGVRDVGNYAFWGCTALTSVTLPDILSQIEHDAFRDCTSLGSLTIPENVSYIDTNAFENTLWLKTMREADPLVIVNGFVIDGQTCKGDLIIPDGAKRIVGDAFRNSAITSAIIPGSVESIDDNAFCGCEKLTTVTMQEGISSLMYNVFEGCTALTDIEIPESINYFGCNIFDGTPWYAARIAEDPRLVVNHVLLDGMQCKGEVTIPDGVVRIEDNAFSENESLTSVSIPGSVKEIGYMAFCNCTKLSALTLADGVKKIEADAFSGTALTEVTIPESVRQINNYAFSCEALATVAILNPDCVISGDSTTFSSYGASAAKPVIRGYADSTAQAYAEESGYPFESLGAAPAPKVEPGSGTCGEDLTWELDETGSLTISGTGEMDGCFGGAPWGDKITSVTISEGVTSIDYDAFNGAEHLTSVTLPSTLESIEIGAFAGCKRLTSIVIPEGVQKLQGGTFSGCEALTDVTIPETVTFFGGNDFDGTPWLEAKRAEDPLVVINSIVIDGKECQGEVLIPVGIKAIAMQAFYHNDKMTAVTLPASVTLIDNYAFADCSALTSVTVLNPDMEFTLTEGVTNGEDENHKYFYNGVIRGYSYTTAEHYAVERGFTFESLGELPYEPATGTCGEDLTWTLDETGTLTISGTGNMDSCMNGSPWSNQIKKVVVEEGVNSLGNSAFKKCIGLTSVELPASLRLISGYVFEDCIRLEELSIPESVSWIDGYALKGTPWLEAQQKQDPLVVVNGILIDGHAFQGESLTIPDGIRLISPNAFDGTGLKEVTIPASVKQVGEHAFVRCPDLAVVTVLSPFCNLPGYYSVFGNDFSSYSGVIRGYDESTAQSYAANKEITFESLGEIPYAGANGTCGEHMTWKIDENGTLTISGTGRMEDYDAYNSINSPWFNYRKHITGVVIEEGVESIGTEAFWSCENIADITIPRSVSSIGAGAFSGTAWMEQQKKEPFVIVNGILLERGTAKGDITIPDTVVRIGPSALSGEAVTSITIPSSVTEIETRGIAYCYSLKKLTVPDSVKTLGTGALEWNSALEEVTLSAGVESIGEDLLRNCEKLKTVRILNPNCLIPDAGSVICNSEQWDEDYTKVEKTTYTGVIEGYQGSTAEAYAKKNGYTFKSLGAAPEDPTEEPTEPPTEQPTEQPTEEPTEQPTEEPTEQPTEEPTEEPTEQPTEPITLSGKCGENLTWTLDSKGTLTISGTGEMDNFDYTPAPWNDAGESIRSLIVEDGVMSIGYKAFVVCSNLSAVSIPDSVKSIDARAFNNTQWLKDQQEKDPMVVLNGILIDGSACQGDVKIPDGVTSIGSGSFASANLKSVTIPDSVTSICHNAFEASRLTTISIPDSVTTIGMYAFAQSDLTTLTILNPDCILPENLFGLEDDISAKTIEGYDGSTAHAYAQKYGIKFRSLSAAPTDTLGDIDGSGTVNASDAANVLIAAAAIGAGKDSGLTAAQKKAADVNGDGSINATDAAIILQYAAAVGAGQKNVKIQDFIRK